MLQLSSIIRRVGFMLLLALQLSVFSQSNYTFTPSTGTYSSISGTDVSLDGNYPTVNIGFTFKFDGVNYTQVTPSKWGWLSFRTGITVSEGDALKDGNLSGSLGRPLIGVLYAQNKTTTGYKSRYLVSGTAPNRVFTFEWYYWTWHWYTNNDICFQVKLYETSNKIELQYHPVNSSFTYNDWAVTSIGLAFANVNDFLSVSDFGSSPSVSTLTESHNFTAMPVDGQTYTFEPKPILTEPTNQCSNVTAAIVSDNIRLNWTDATGGVLPDGYIIKVSKTNSFTDPVDGSIIIDDTDLSDGAGVVKVLQGVQSFYGWRNAESSTHYYFKIYAYTNGGALANFNITSAPTTSLKLIKSLPLKHVTNLQAKNNSGNYVLEWTDGKNFGNSIEFYSSNNSYIDCGNSSLLNITGNAITLAAWVCPNANANDIFQKENSGLNGGYRLYSNGSGQICFGLYIDGNWNELKSPANTLVVGNWSHICGTYDGTTQKIFINGNNVASKSTTGNITTSSSNLFLGESHTSTINYYDGKMDEMAIWSNARSQSEVLSDMNLQLNGTETGLVAYYKCNQGIADANNSGLSTLLDATPYANNATLEMMFLKNNEGDYSTSNTNSDIDGYLILASSTNTFPNVVSGTDIATDNDLADGSGAVKVAQGLQTFGGWINIDASKPYYFRIIPFSNKANEIAYNTSGTIPQISIKPKPTNHVTALIASSVNGNIVINWTDAIGTQLPDGYVLFASTSPIITAPVNGTEISIDNDLSNGTGVVKVLPGVQAFSGFTGFVLNTVYYFNIYPYTNGNALISYKTDGTVPQTGGKIALYVEPTSHATAFTANNYGLLTLSWSDAPGMPSLLSNVLNFDGSNDLVTCSGSQNTSIFTAEAWFSTGITNADMALVSTINEGAGSGFEIHVGSNGKPVVTIRNSSTWLDVASPNVITANKWTHVAATYDGATVKLYVDGQLMSSAALPAASFVKGTSPLVIGRRSSGLLYFNGSIDEVRIWNIARSQTDIQNNMNNELFGNENGLLSYYKFNQGAAGGANSGVTTLTDATVNAFNGTLSGFTLTGATSNWINPGQAPSGYLIKASTTNSFTDPVDGTEIATENDLSDGAAVIKVSQGTQIYSSFAGTIGGTTYYFKMWPYTNSGNYINYKTAVTAPTASITFTKPGPLTHVTSLTANNNNKVINVSWTDAKAVNMGNAIALDGANDYITVPDGSIDNGTNTAFTIETWLYWNPVTSSDVHFICGKGLEQMEIHTSGDAGANGLRFIPTSGIYLDAYNVLPVNKWTHVAVVYDATNSFAKMYINGTEVTLIKNGPGVMGTALQNTTSQFDIGRRPYLASLYYKGKIDEFRVWNKVRTQNEIVANMLNELPASETGLLAYYKFNQGNGYNANTGLTLVTDASSAANNGTLTNSALTGSTSNWINFRADAPDGYLIKASKTNNITTPVNGTVVTDDNNLADGAGTVNILAGVQTYSGWTNFTDTTAYYYKVYPYSNSGTSRVYNTSVPVPMVKDSVGIDRFKEISAGISNLVNGKSKWADYDNDGDLDLLLFGSDEFVNITAPINCVTKLYQNNGNNNFDEVPTGIINISEGDAAWGDYNNDGLLDLIIAGVTQYASNGMVLNSATKLYKQLPDHSFELQSTINFPAHAKSGVAWGDYDNDGDLDLLLSGVGTLYRNNGNNSFTEQKQIAIESVHYGSAAWGDYNKDGFLDILITGNSNKGEITKIYKNNQNNYLFEQKDIEILGLAHGSAVWGDYDNDGDLDILLNGNNGSSQVTTIYKNNYPTNSFTEVTNLNLTATSYGDAQWGDINNDGLMDIVVTGNTGVMSYSTTEIFLQNPDHTFSQYTANAFKSGGSASMSLADYDGDNDLDLFITGHQLNPAYFFSALYQNNLELYKKNIKPNPPLTLNHSTQDDYILLSWNKATDDKTISNGLTYNIQVGTTKNSFDIISPNSKTIDNSGLRRVVELGNCQQDTFKLIKWHAAGRYYWKVQSIDNSYIGSNFSAVDSIQIDSIQASELTIRKIENTKVLAKWKRGNGSKCAVFCAKDSAGRTAWPVNEYNYFHAPTFGLGENINPTRWLCVYNGINDSVIIDGLDPALTYTIQVVEYITNNTNYTPRYIRKGSPNNDDWGIFAMTDYSSIATLGGGTGPNNVQWYDYNKDGYLDYFYNTHASVKVPIGVDIKDIFKGLNNGGETFTRDNSEGSMYNTTICIADFNNDDLLDHIITDQYIDFEILTDNTNLIKSHTYYSTLVRNTTNQGFHRCAISLPVLTNASIDIGDYDNDDFLDIAMCGINLENGLLTTKIFRNNQDSTFSEDNSVLINTQGTIKWGDFNNDEYNDLLLTSSDSLWVYKNLGNDRPINTKRFIIDFSIKKPDALSKIKRSTWLDQDNDGDLDIIITGSNTNDKDTSILLTNLYPLQLFTQDNITHFVQSPEIKTADYDNDGDVDYISGSQLYRNNATYAGGFYKPNRKPDIPDDLKVIRNNGKIKLEWSAITSDETDSTNMTYDVRLRRKGETHWFNAPVTNSSGYRRIVSLGRYKTRNANINLPFGEYEWQVQAIDQGFESSNWSEISNFSISSYFIVDTVCLGDSTTFVDQSTIAEGQAAWLWDFGDNSFSNMKNPKHKFTTPGKHRVSLSVNSYTFSDTIVVNDTLKVAFDAEDVCAGLATKIKNSTQTNGYTQWRWDFGDNTPISTNGDIDSHSFPQLGSYTITLTATDSKGCPAKATKNVVVTTTPNPTLIRNYGNPSFCKGDSVIYSVQSNPIYNYQWIQNNQIIDEYSNSIKVKTESGKYKVLIENSLASTCSAMSEEIDITVKDIPAQPVINPESDKTAFCKGDSVTLSAATQAGVTYHWYLNDGPLQAENNSFNAKEAGRYTLKTSFENGCYSVSSLPVNITVNALPLLPSLSYGNTSICSGQNITFAINSINPNYTYKWQKNSITIDGATSYSYTTGEAGEYGLLVENTNYCSVKTTPIAVVVKDMPVKPLIFAENNSTLFCPGSTSKLMVTDSIASYSYQWKRSGISIDGANQPSLKGKLSAGDYNIEAKNGDCAVESDIITLNTKPAPAKPDIFARGPNVWIVGCNNTTASNYTWYFNDSPILGAKKHYYVANQNLGYYYVEIQEGNECTTKSDIIKIPDGTIINDVPTLSGDNILLFPNPTESYFNVTLGGNLQGLLYVDILNSLGDVLAKYQFSDSNGFNINISELPKGVYFCKMQHNSSVLVKKIVKQ